MFEGNNDIWTVFRLPTYDYRCDQCGSEFELRLRFSDSVEQPCNSCDNIATRQFSAVPIVFKGSGWYVNDYGKKGSSSGNNSGTASSDTTTGEATSESKSDNSSESKSDNSSKSTASKDNKSSSTESSTGSKTTSQSD